MPESIRKTKIGENLEVHLRNDVMAMESQFQEDLNLSAGYDWGFCVAKYNTKKDDWVSFVGSFQDFEKADEKFKEKANNKTNSKIENLRPGKQSRGN